jgi:glycosyltransferase involved in cell wall biosynthesis
MRIGIEAQRILRLKKHGMDVVALELIKNLQQIDKTNRYFVFARQDKDEFVIKKSDNLELKKSPSLTYFDWEQIKLKKLIKSNDIDLLHCTANTAPLKLHLPFIVTIHDIIYLEKIDFKGTAYQNVGNLYRRFIVPKIANRADLILTVSNFERENIIENLKIPENKVQVLYNGVSDVFNNRYSEVQLNEFRKEYNLPKNYIMFLGNTAPKKNTRNVIRAYTEYCNSEKAVVPLVLLDYKRELVEKYLVELRGQHLIKNFIFPGYVPHRQMALMYCASSLFLYPSLRESFGLPILEAMACGTPVITSNTSCMPEIAGDAAKQIDPLNYSEMAEAIKGLLQSNSCRNVYVEKGLERVKKFTWTASAETLLNIYNSFQ